MRLVPEADNTEDWKEAVNQALEVAQTAGVPLSAVLDYANGGDGTVALCDGSGEREAIDDMLAANHEAEPCPGCPNCSPADSTEQVEEDPEIRDAAEGHPGVPAKWRCPVCKRAMSGPDERCNGAFTERGHPSGVKPEPIPTLPSPEPKDTAPLGGSENLNILPGSYLAKLHEDTAPAQPSEEPRRFQIVRCKVCGENMRGYDHGLYRCACESWGEVEDPDLGLFDDARHEIAEVILFEDHDRIVTSLQQQLDTARLHVQDQRNRAIQAEQRADSLEKQRDDYDRQGAAAVIAGGKLRGQIRSLEKQLGVLREALECAGPEPPPYERLLESLRWAMGYIDRLRKFDPDEKPCSGGEEEKNWFEWASAHDWLKDAALVDQPSENSEAGQ